MTIYSNSVRDERVRDYLPPVRIVASSGIDDPEFFVNKTIIQSHNVMTAEDYRVLSNGAWILLDFGQEIAGGIRLTTYCKGGAVRIRFGESVSEAMSSPNQDHSPHDSTVMLPFMGTFDYGSTGFRFVRIDICGGTIQLAGITAIAVYRDLPRMGSFECSDALINKIYETAVYTVQLNMQDYIYDGIKRDRLVWLGDLNPEIRVILATFADHSLIRKSLDYVRDRTPLPQYMNTMMSYSLWWVINQYDLYLQDGDMDYLRKQQYYLGPLVRHFAEMVQDDGTLDMKGRTCFLDWPTADNHDVQNAGSYGLFSMMFDRARALCSALQDDDTAALAQKCHDALAKKRPDCLGNKTAAAMLTLSGLNDCTSTLTTNNTKGVSTYYGFYMLLAQPVSSALEVIRKYWGGMLSRGATTFWEDFDLDWLADSNRIDELHVPGKKDLHADFGKHCYVGLRHSLCHGWSGGPAAALMHKVLGVTVNEPGARNITVKPDLGDLQFARGTYPTPLGPVYINKIRGQNTIVTAPDGISVTVID